MYDFTDVNFYVNIIGWITVLVLIVQGAFYTLDRVLGGWLSHVRAQRDFVAFCRDRRTH